MIILFRLAVSLLAGLLLLLFHLVAVAVGCVVYVYFLPGVIAMKRNAPQTDRVFIFCALLAWTVIGWAAALAYALSLHQEPDQGRLVANQ